MPALHIEPLPCFRDNYIWLAHDGARAWAVDPGDAAPVLAALRAGGLALAGILVTHHHDDHIGGIATLQRALGGERATLPVLGPREAGDCVNHLVAGGEQLTLPVLGRVDVLAVGAHTHGHLAFHLPGAQALFCGDALFSAGCGRLFEGTPADLQQALARIAALPDATRCHPAHEYTLSNLRFAAAVEPGNEDIRRHVATVQAGLAEGRPSLPTPLARERLINPFLRSHLPALAAAASRHAGEEIAPGLSTLAVLRRWKDDCHCHMWQQNWPPRATKRVAKASPACLESGNRPGTGYFSYSPGLTFQQGGLLLVARHHDKTRIAKVRWRWLALPLALWTLAASADDKAQAPAPVSAAPHARLDAQETIAETVTLSNGEVLVLNLPASAPATAPRVRAQDYGDDNNLLSRMRDRFSLEIPRESRVQNHEQWLAGKQQYLDRVMSRASRFLYGAVNEAERRGLPVELALLPVIESAYDPTATSRSQAAGLWQFIPDTGRLHGLQQTWYYDGRRDPVESTRAAFDYLSQLYNTFHDWALVLASYNAGPGTVSRAMKRNAAAGLPTDYWSLRLPAETMAYVPRFLAVVSMFREPERFGVNLPNIPNRPYFRSVDISGAMTLNDAAALTGLSPSTLRELNPGLRRDSLEPSGGRLHVPATLDVALESRLSQRMGGTPVLVADQAEPLPLTPVIQTVAMTTPADSAGITRVATSNGFENRYEIRQGDTWYSLARRFGMSVAALQAANPNAGRALSLGQSLQVPQVQRAEVEGAVIAVASPLNDQRIELRRAVRQGDTLDSLRRQYNVTLAELRAWNGDLQRLKVGQVLTLRVLPSMLNKSL